MLAYEQNGERLTPDHGYPLRLVIPGYIGGRMIKWLSEVSVTSEESDNHFHYMDNRVLPEFVDAERATAEGWWYKPDFIINELNINSAIAFPGHQETVRALGHRKGPRLTHSLTHSRRAPPGPCTFEWRASSGRPDVESRGTSLALAPPPSCVVCGGVVPDLAWPGLASLAGAPHRQGADIHSRRVRVQRRRAQDHPRRALPRRRDPPEIRPRSARDSPEIRPIVSSFGQRRDPPRCPEIRRVPREMPRDGLVGGGGGWRDPPRDSARLGEVARPCGDGWAGLLLVGGKTWTLTTIKRTEKPTEFGRFWCWVFWEHEVEVSDLFSMGRRGLGRSGEIWGDLGRSGEAWGDLGRSGEIWGGIEDHA